MTARFLDWCTHLDGDEDFVGLSVAFHVLQHRRPVATSSEGYCRSTIVPEILTARRFAESGVQEAIAPSSTVGARPCRRGVASKDKVCRLLWFAMRAGRQRNRLHRQKRGDNSKEGVYELHFEPRSLLELVLINMRQLQCIYQGRPDDLHPFVRYSVVF